MSDNNPIMVALGFALCFVVLICGGIGSCSAYNHYRVYSAEQAGRATLAEAESSRRIKVLEAQAAKDSAVSLAQAEVIRAQGVAKANKIIAEGLGGPQGYLEYLKIDAMKDTKDQVIYVPTEAGLPITESGRLTTIQRSTPDAQ